MSRWWVVTVVAGLAALALSLAIANGDTGAPGFTRALVTLEGTLTTLSPGYLVIAAAEQIAAE